MLEGWIVNPNKPITTNNALVLGSPKGQQQWDDWKFRPAADKLSITIAEAKRRDELIRNEWRDCKLFKNMEVVHHEEKSRVLYGKCVVRGIAKNIDDYGTVDWPKNDVPFIVTVTSEHKGEINCTGNYFIPKERSLSGSCT